jgi:small neutral amino acid transporter SnatA (MarC family)
MDNTCLSMLWASGAMLGVLAVTALSLRVADRMAELLGELGAAALRLVLL